MLLECAQQALLELAHRARLLVVFDVEDRGEAVHLLWGVGGCESRSGGGVACFSDAPSSSSCLMTVPTARCAPHISPSSCITAAPSCRPVAPCCISARRYGAS